MKLFLCRTSLIILVYAMLNSVYSGMNGMPNEGDSIAYHIPIARSILDGSFIGPQVVFRNDHQYFPGSSEFILAAFILVGIPITLYNVLGIACLFLATWGLGKASGLDGATSVTYACSIGTLNTILRWSNAQTVDIWLGVFYALALMLLMRPRPTATYFGVLGFAIGMIIGTKYSGPLFLIAPLVLLGRRLIPLITVPRVIAFIMPVCVLGLFWYARNLIVTGNPVYPQGILFLRGNGTTILSVPVWRATVLYP